MICATKLRHTPIYSFIIKLEEKKDYYLKNETSIFLNSLQGFYYNKKKTPLVQLVERWFPKPDVIGSIPIGRVLFSFDIKKKTTLRV